MTKRRGLWVEDQSQSFLAIRDVLEEAVDKVDVADTAVDADALMNKERYDVVVVDLLLPRGGSQMASSAYLGLDVLRKAPTGAKKVVVTFMGENEVELATKTIEGIPAFKYFNKLEIGPRLNELLDALGGAKPSPAGESDD